MRADVAKLTALGFELVSVMCQTPDQGVAFKFLSAKPADCPTRPLHTPFENLENLSHKDMSLKVYCLGLKLVLALALYYLNVFISAFCS